MGDSRAPYVTLDKESLAMYLGDPDIRSALIERLNRQNPSPKRILEELTVHDGKAIADVVAVFKTPHCYEIKGDADSIARAVAQSKFYDRVFKRITLVTTERHVVSALRTLPDYWGVISARKTPIGIMFKYYRKATQNPNFSPTQALMTLWKVELLELATKQSIEKIKRLNRLELAGSISERLGKKRADEFIGSYLIKRRY